VDMVAELRVPEDVGGPALEVLPLRVGEATRVILALLLTRVVQRTSLGRR
jgi:hypothetical protein